MNMHLLAALFLSAAPAIAQQSISTLPPPVVTDPQDSGVARQCAGERSLCLGHHGRPDHRSRTAARSDRSRGASTRLGRPPADGDRLRQRPRRAIHHAGLDARCGKRGDRLTLPAEAGCRGAGLQRLDRPRRRHCPDRLFPQRRCASRGARKRRQGQDRVHRPQYDAGAGRLGLRPVRRAHGGRVRRSPRSKARSRSSSARLAPTIIAIRTPAFNISPMAQSRSRQAH